MNIDRALEQRMDAFGRPSLDHWTKHTRMDWETVLQGVDLRGKRADAFGNEFIVPELIHLSKIANEQVFPENTYAQAFALASDLPAWYDIAYNYNDNTYSGSPENVSGDFSDPGIPVGISRSPNLSPIRPITVNYSVNIAEMARLGAQGTSAMAAKAKQARRVVDTAFDIWAWRGYSKLSIPGYCTTTGISRDTVPTVGGHTTWTSKTGPEIYEDVRLICQAINDNSKGVFFPTHMAVPQKLKTILTKPMVLGGVMLNMSVAAYIEAQLSLTVLYTVRLNDVDKNGAAGTGAVALYQKGEDTQRSLIVRDYYELGPQQVGRTMTVYADGVSGGLVIPQPTSAALWDGVA